jgi:pilus assembly protein Flp/PilA
MYDISSSVWPFNRSFSDSGNTRAMTRKIQAFLADQSAATAIEYALIAAGLSIVIVAAVNSIGTQLNTTFTGVSTQLK